ncbi:hypothetical protein [Amycolatopsis sp. NPDC001319]|uniref:hypothetical protein n=1 Tax=unclassified Amycolatopsis TaxID=2618356 RepID=UPI0036CF061A
MIETKDTDALEVTDSHVFDVARLAAVHVRYGEMRLPQRIADNLADTDKVRVTVLRRAVRGYDELGSVAADRDGVTLFGIAWPEGVVGGTRVTVACARRSHVVQVVLPAVEAESPFLPADDAGESTVQAPTVEPDDAPTEVLAAVGQLDEDGPHTEPLPTVRRAPRFAVWMRLFAFFRVLVDLVATSVRLSARWELEHSRTVARLIVATLSALVLAGVGVLAVIR